MIRYLSVAQVLRLHQLQIEGFGGAPGLRDRGALEAALARPEATFDGEDIYPDAIDKGAALLHSLVANHPFVDGNKRVGVMACELFLLVNGLELTASDDDLTALTLAVARGEIESGAVAIWIRQRTRALSA